MAKTAAEKILAHLKGLQNQMRAREEPLFSMPAIWENATEHQTNACDLVLTNQRLFGYIYTTFPRERLFLDALELNAIVTVSLRKKNFEAMFRELFVSDGTKRIYIRATRKKIESAYTALQEASARYAPETHISIHTGRAGAENEQAGSFTRQENEQTNLIHEPVPRSASPTFSRQQIRQPLERSPLGITLLLVGGVLLEIVGVLIWAATGSAQTGGPLCLAGLVAVIVATLARRQLR